MEFSDTSTICEGPKLDASKSESVMPIWFYLPIQVTSHNNIEIYNIVLYDQQYFSEYSLYSVPHNNIMNMNNVML